MNRISALLLAFFALAAKADDTTPATPPAAATPTVTFAKQIKPIFERSCVKCHGGEKAKAKLHLDTLEGALKGGEDGKMIKPGDSADSQLFQSVAHLNEEDMWMPPMKNKLGIKPLTKDEVALIRAWIDQGAK